VFFEYFIIQFHHLSRGAFQIHGLYHTALAGHHLHIISQKAQVLVTQIKIL